MYREGIDAYDDVSHGRQRRMWNLLAAGNQLVYTVYLTPSKGVCIYII